MSQLVDIVRVDVQGAPVFVGLADGQTSEYSRDGERVMQWLCDGWRCRFNQLRSRRKKHGPDHELVPVGNTVDEHTMKTARQDFPWLAAMPDTVLASPERVEPTQWWAAVQRRKTLKKQGRNPGRMPRFRSRKHDDQTFTCWYHGGRNALLTVFNKRHAMVAITGQNPPGRREHGVRWKIRIHVRLTRPVREYTSVRVNWTKRTLSFTNLPTPIRHTPTGTAVGVDRGVAHAAAQSDGTFLDLPAAKLANIDREIARRQRAMARKANLSGKTRRQYVKDGPSKRYRKERERVAALYARRTRIVTDIYHKHTTRLVHECDTIVIEVLNLAAMTRKANKRADPARPGRYLPNGQTAKRGLNRVLSRSNLGLVRRQLQYKTTLSGGDTLLIEVDPAYTSQTCFRCGHTDAKNRESQADFTCVNCGHHANADLNAARNILEAGLRAIAGMDDAPRETTLSDTVNTLREHCAWVPTRKPRHSN